MQHQVMIDEQTFSVTAGRAFASARARSRWRRVGCLALSLFLLAPVTSVWAQPSGPVQDAYNRALGLFAEVELEEALKVTDEAIQNEVDAGRAEDPRLAALLFLRAALTYSLRGDEAAEQILASLRKALELNEFAELPSELRSSEGLRVYLDKAREERGPVVGDSIRALRVDAECGEPLVLRVVARLPEGGRVVAYWRRSGQPGFQPRTLSFFAGAGEVQIDPGEHGDNNVDYYFALLDGNERETTSIGSPTSPLHANNPCAPKIVSEKDAKNESDKPRRQRLTGYRFSFGLGLGTGIGIANGTTDYSYVNYAPDSDTFVYNAGHAACAAARHAGRGGKLPGPERLWGSDRENPSEASVFGLMAGDPTTAAGWAAAYNADVCAEHHSVTRGLASAPFHLTPRIRVKVTDRFSLGMSMRLQVVTASNLHRPASYSSDLSGNLVSPNPQGEKIKVGMPWQIAVDGRYEFGKPSAKLRPYLGGFFGYGTTRLRVDMNFGPDYNGNSVPDVREFACDGNVAVFPFAGACDDVEKQQLAFQVKQNASRYFVFDTVTLGPVAFGAIAGFNWALAPRFSIFGEVQIGGWFGGRKSMLIDLNVGPNVHF